jgi:hypothetical protein
VIDRRVVEEFGNPSVSIQFHGAYYHIFIQPIGDCDDSDTTYASLGPVPIAVLVKVEGC